MKESGQLEREETVAYLRVSTREQAEKGLGIDVQRDRVKALAKEKGLLIAKFYIDKGKSGKLKDRPGLNQLLSDIAVNGIGYVLAYSLDRLARNLTLSLMIEQDFKKNGITLITVLERSFDLDDPFQKFIKNMREGMAELEAGLITLRTMSGKRKKASQGGYPSGTAPLGFRWTGEKPHRTIVVDDKGKEMVKLIYKTYLEKQSLGKVQKELERRGIRTVNTKRFSREQIRKILLNPIYKGKFKRLGMEQRIEAIIFIRTWNKVQNKIKERSRKRAGKALSEA